LRSITTVVTDWQKEIYQEALKANFGPFMGVD
jgi:hypothetical protein